MSAMDAFAFRRGHRYATAVIELQRRRVLRAGRDLIGRDAGPSAAIHDAGPSSDAAPGSAEAQGSQRTARRPSAPPSPFSTLRPSCSPSEHRPETYEFRNRL